MAKRLVKIQNPTNEDLTKNLNLDLSLVLKDNAVYFGQICEIKEFTVIFNDKIRRIIKIQDIKEILIDKLHSND
jgi:hypothetical protein